MRGNEKVFLKHIDVNIYTLKNLKYYLKYCQKMPIKILTLYIPYKIGPVELFKVKKVDFKFKK